jgi:hypothetical protein
MHNRLHGLRRVAALLPAFAWAMVGFSLTACDDDEDVIEPLPIEAQVAVFVDSAVDFSEFLTFAMPDTVVHILPLTVNPLDVTTREFDQEILDRVRLNFTSRGYLTGPHPTGTRPDFVVLVAVVETQSYVAWASYPWHSIWGFVEGSWFGGDSESLVGTYPWANATVITYPRGTLIVQLIPTLSVTPADNQIRAAWAGVATALMTGNITSDDVLAAIDEMFVLSPYLRAGTQ